MTASRRLRALFGHHAHVRRARRAIGVLCAFAAAALPAPAQEIPGPVRDAMARAGVADEHIALRVLAPDGGIVADHRGGVPMQPASTMKLVTAATALAILGPDWRGRTELLAGTPSRGVLQGPFALRGRGDTDLDVAALWGLLRELRDGGVHTIRGDLVVDRTWFRPARPDLDAEPFDEHPQWPYNTVPDALSHNASLLHFEIESDAAGRVTLRTQPRVPGLVLIDRTERGDQRCEDWERGWLPPLAAVRGDNAWVVVRGRFPPGCRAQAALDALDRQWVLAQLVRRWWRELGGRWDGRVVEGPVPDGLAVRAVHRGRTLWELLRPMTKASDNPITRIVFEALGAEAGTGAGPTREAAAAVVRGQFARHGIDAAGLVLDNGSGLSRSERITAAQMAAWLRAALADRHGAELRAAMPLAGVDGTLRRRLRGGPAEGRARLKTGTLFNVVALAGVVPDAAGREHVVAVFVNLPGPARGVRPVVDALVEWVAARP